MNERTLTLSWDSRDLEVLRGGRIEGALLRALRKAGGDAARALQVGTGKLVRQRKALKVARVKRGLPLHFPRNKAGISDLEWRMDVSGELVPLAEYPHRQTKRGVMVSVNVGARKLVKSAFVARMRSGHVGVFRRRGEKRLPIDEGFSTRLSDVVQDSGFIPFVQAGAQARFESAFKRLLPLELGKLRRG